GHNRFRASFVERLRLAGAPNRRRSAVRLSPDDRAAEPDDDVDACTASCGVAAARSATHSPWGCPELGSTRSSGQRWSDRAGATLHERAPQARHMPVWPFGAWRAGGRLGRAVARTYRSRARHGPHARSRPLKYVSRATSGVEGGVGVQYAPRWVEPDPPAQ